jgi:BirA family biotin operon repressor/biotin-[acetyl-CoA-carboxylase] ligase
MAELLRRILEECEGKFVSGQDIGRRMGMSRAAVWKQVQGLRRRGFGIEGARGAGYRLLGRPDVIEEQELFSRLSRTDFRKSFVFFPVTDSTNSRAVELAGKGGAHGTVVCADSLTGVKWMGVWSLPVNLYFLPALRPLSSLLHAPRLRLSPPSRWRRWRSARAHGVKAKWPNDPIWADGRPPESWRKCRPTPTVFATW